MRRFMIDLETLATDPRAVITTLGCVEFNEKGMIPGRKLYRRVDFCVQQPGAVIDSDTVQWWMQQAEEARYEIFTKSERSPLPVVLLELSQFVVGDGSEYELWAGPAHFDAPVLQSAYRSHGVVQPWTHRQVRCLSTFRKMMGTQPVEEAGAHHALKDCEAQVAEWVLANDVLAGLRKFADSGGLGFAFPT